ncbi:MAG: radical SAM protein [Clostridia bacterium]|nr:radical SAM protein [Clostridia bacterium]
MNNYKLNIREESFGGTLLDLAVGKRIFVNSIELREIICDNRFPKDLKAFSGIMVPEIKFTPISKNEGEIKYFAFADIAFLEITRECNLRCRHCLNNSGEEMSKHMSTNDIKNLISKLAVAGIQEIRFTGGEPLIIKGIFELIKYATDLGIYTSIGTNGTLITENVALKLKQSGLKKVVISLDGTEKSHDYIRGKGNYLKTCKAMEYIRQYGIELKINSVIMRDNMDDVISLAKEMHIKKYNMFIRRFIESGRGINLVGNMLTKTDYEYVNKKLTYELSTGQYIRGHYIRLQDESNKPRIELPFKLKTGCKAGQRAMVITPNGDIHFCGFLAAQGFKSIANISDIKDWRLFWNGINPQCTFKDLQKALDEYNFIDNIQQTNCLAYAQRLINMKEETKKEDFL